MFKFQSLDNCDNERVSKKVIITSEKYRKNLYKVEEVVMITNWIHKIDKNNNKRETKERKKKHQINERYDIRGKLAKVKHQVRYVIETEVIDLREDIKEIKNRITYDWILKIK